jgi:hypothetical protein
MRRGDPEHDGSRDALAEQEAVASIELTLLVAAVTVPLNAVSGVAAVWCIGRRRYGHRLWASIMQSDRSRAHDRWNAKDDFSPVVSCRIIKTLS